MNNFTYPIYLFLGIIPSVIWLLFYLRKDVHPESNPMILRIFFFGMLITLPAVLIEFGLYNFLDQTLKINSHPTLISVSIFFFGLAFIEELLKFLVVREKVFSHSELDEPIDVMLYMIIAALGFAAVENIITLSSLGPVFKLGSTLSVIVFRFWGATFLHALCSGTFGYFLAMSFCEPKKANVNILSGIIIVTLLHGFYNFFIINMKEEISFLAAAIILISLAIFVSWGFQRLKNIKSTCKITN